MASLSYASNLDEQIARNKVLLSSLKLHRFIYLFFSVIFIVTYIFILLIFFEILGGEYSFNIKFAISCLFILFLLSCAFVVFSFFFFNNKIINISELLCSLENEKELQQSNVLTIEQKADKQFRYNQREIKRYYDVNLLHTKLLLGFGVLLLLIGLGIIVIIIVLYFQSNDISNLILVLGGISGLLIDFIGAVFVCVYAKTIKMGISFYAKLVGSNDLLLSNAIAAKIKNSNLRDKTLSEIAKNISLNNSSKR